MPCHGLRAFPMDELANLGGMALALFPMCTLWMCQLTLFCHERSLGLRSSAFCVLATPRPCLALPACLPAHGLGLVRAGLPMASACWHVGSSPPFHLVGPPCPMLSELWGTIHPHDHLFRDRGHHKELSQTLSWHRSFE